MARTFGTIKVVDITPAKKEGWFRVKFEQEVHSNGNEASPTGLGLESAVQGFNDKRTCYENVSQSTIDSLGLKVGAELKGFNIARYRHEMPVSDNHKPGGNGGYYTTKLVQDTLATEYTVEKEVSQRMYDEWKANSNVALGAGSTPLASQIID